MTDEINRTLGRIEGTLIEFKDNANKRFDDIHEAANLATNTARVAQEKADNAHAYAKTIVQRAGFAGGTVSFIVLGFVWIIEHTPKAFAFIAGNH